MKHSKCSHATRVIRGYDMTAYIDGIFRVVVFVMALLEVHDEAAVIHHLRSNETLKYVHREK